MNLGRSLTGNKKKKSLPVELCCEKAADTNGDGGGGGGGPMAVGG